MLALFIMTTNIRKIRNTNLNGVMSALEQAHLSEIENDYTADVPLDYEEIEYYDDEEEEENYATGTHNERYEEERHHHQPQVGAEKGVYRGRLTPKLQGYVSRAISSFLERYQRVEPALYADHPSGPRDIILVRAIYSRDLRRWRSERKEPTFHPWLPYEEAFAYFHLYRIQFARARTDNLLTKALRDLSTDMRATATSNGNHKGGAGAAERRAERRHPPAPRDAVSLWDYTHDPLTHRVTRDQSGIQALEALARVDLQRIANIGTAHIVEYANARIRVALHSEIYSIAHGHTHVPYQAVTIGQDIKRSESELMRAINNSGGYYERAQRTATVRITCNLERLKRARASPLYNTLNGANGEWTSKDDTEIRFCHSQRDLPAHPYTDGDCLHTALATALNVPPERFTRQYTYGYAGTASAIVRYSAATRRRIHVLTPTGLYSITATTSSFPDLYLTLIDYHYTTSTMTEFNTANAIIDSYRYSDLIYRPRMTLEDVGAELDGNGDRLANMAAIADAFAADDGRGHHVRQVYANNDDDTVQAEREAGVPRARQEPAEAEDEPCLLRAAFDHNGTTSSTHPIAESDMQRAERGVILAQNLQHSIDRLKATNLEGLRHSVNKSSSDALVARMACDEASMLAVHAIRRDDKDTAAKVAVLAGMQNATVDIGRAQGDLDRTLAEIALSREMTAADPMTSADVRTFLQSPDAIKFYDERCGPGGTMAANSGMVARSILTANVSNEVLHATTAEVSILQKSLNLHSVRCDIESLHADLQRHIAAEKHITTEACLDLASAFDVLNAKYDRQERAHEAENRYEVRQLARNAQHRESLARLRADLREQERRTTAINSECARDEAAATFGADCALSTDRLRMELECKTQKFDLKVETAALDTRLATETAIRDDEAVERRTLLKSERHARTGHRLAGLARTAALLAADSEHVATVATVTPDYLARMAAGLHANEALALTRFESDMRDAERQWKIADMKSNGPAARKTRSCPLEFRPLTKELYTEEHACPLGRMAVDSTVALHGYQGSQRYRIRPPFNRLAPPSPLRDLIDQTDLVQVVIFNTKKTRTWAQWLSRGLLTPWKRSARNILNSAQEDYYSLGRWHNPDAARPIYDGNMYVTPELMLSSSNNSMVPILNNYKFLGIGFSTLRDLLGSTDDYISAKGHNHYAINMVSPVVYAEATKLAIGTNCGMLMVNNILRSLRDFHELVPLDLLYNSISAAVQHVDILRHMVMSQHPNAASSLPN